jgi:hypothetical protein
MVVINGTCTESRKCTRSTFERRTQSLNMTAEDEPNVRYGSFGSLYHVQIIRNCDTDCARLAWMAFRVQRSTKDHCRDDSASLMDKTSGFAVHIIVCPRPFDVPRERELLGTKLKTPITW